MLSWVAILFILGSNWSECLQDCEVVLSEGNTAEDMETTLLWRRTDAMTYLGCVLLCITDPICSSVQVSINSSTCLAFKDGLWLKTSVDNGKLHYLTCREKTTSLKPRCEATKDYIYNGNTSHPICLKLHKAKLTWDKARLRCHKEGAELIELNAPDKLEAMQQLISTTKTSRWDTLETWVGLLKDESRKGHVFFNWTGTNVAYSGKWAPSKRTEGNCGGLGLDGLVVKQCQTYWRFMCEIK